MMGSSSAAATSQTKGTGSDAGRADNQLAALCRTTHSSALIMRSVATDRITRSKHTPTVTTLDDPVRSTSGTSLQDRQPHSHIGVHPSQQHR